MVGGTLPLHCLYLWRGGQRSWILVFWAIAIGGQSIIARVVATVIVLLMFLNNYGKVNKLFHGILMTLWQMLFGLIIYGIFIMADSNKRKRSKRGIFTWRVSPVQTYYNAYIFTIL